MGCGQSKIGIYQRKSKSKKNGNKRTGEGGESEEETEEAEDRIIPDSKNATDETDGENASDAVTSKIKQMAQQQQQSTGGALLAESDISSSQLDFFKMLDEKIENGPDYEGDDEEEKARLASLLQEWKAASMSRQQKKNGPVPEQEKWSSPARNVTYADDYGSYPIRAVGGLDTQRFPTGYSPCPPNATIGIHLQNTFRAPPFQDQPRMQPRQPYPYHGYQQPADGMNHCEEAPGHPLSTPEPPNPLRANYPPVAVRQTPVTALHYPENQRLYPGQYPESPRTYVEARSYTLPRVMPTVNVLHEQRMYVQDGRPYPERVYPDGRQNVMVTYQDPQRQDPPRLLPDSQRLYHDRLLEGQRQFPDGQRQHVTFQRPPLLAQRSFQEPRIYRDLESEECFQRGERFDQDGPSRVSNFKMGRSVSVDVQYVAGPPPPREIIPLQGGPGPPQGSPRPLAARALQMSMHRLPSNSVVQFRKSRGAFTELA